MSKILGDGHVRKTGRSCVILEKQHNRLVDLPDSALRLNYEKKYYEPENGDHLIFSAQLQNGRYSALTAIKPTDLLQVYGSLSYLDEQLKFGHVSIHGRTAKVFVPFSTRTTNGACWYGQGAYIDKPYLIYIFRQEEAHGCKFVAWAIYDDTRKTTSVPPTPTDIQNTSHMKKLGPPTAVQRQSDHQSVEFVQAQSGVIYDISDNYVISVTSPTCQNVEFAPTLYESWMRPGRFITFDGRRVSDVKTSKLMGSNPEDMGSIYPIRKLTPLTITISAIMNKVSHGKAGWAWNDHVGRIYIPWNSTDRYMQASKPLPFTPVHLEIAYNGKHDDIPWVACGSSLVEEQEYDQIVDENSRMLKTEDNWKIQSVVDGPENPSIFLAKFDEKGLKRTAFAKVIDLNSGNIPPTGTLVRITYYAQERHGRHAMRCVLVTTMEKVERFPKVHSIINGSGEKHFPMMYEQPIPKKQVIPPTPVQRVQAAPPPAKNCWNLKNLGSPAAQPSVQDFPTVTGDEDDNIFVEETNTALPPPGFVPPGLVAPPGLPPPPGLPAVPLSTDLAYDFKMTSSIPMTNGLGHLRLGSVWSGTPVEAKQEEPLHYFQQQDNFLGSSFGPISSTFSADNFFTELTASISQPSTSSVVNSGPISDLRNTQSEASSPGLKSDGNEPVEETNCWSSLEAATNGNNPFNSSFSYGFPHMDLPIYQKMMPNANDILKPMPLVEEELKPATSATHSEADSCTCGTEQLIWDLWQNPHFIAAFAASDPETFKRVDAKRKLFSLSNHR
ncbi:TRansport of membrane to Cell Surface [Caenorhabditis elegans]|uniref:TRansport of membrane to Cell Surface n=1 Tax=Caenorhabditis elegans TaxID=6239 RepID=Q22047_CAEEL|nr:TRansport of membrane to Cell Surface [Caenorhabditis elegans]CAA91299.3 TRansport of membrane to Cell Surface [Caenorhabditis elegans]|eukprot:NP_495857.3 TRansport of membrane to Cell Surface [Caenorhabditis elegans]